MLHLPLRAGGICLAPRVAILLSLALPFVVTAQRPSYPTSRSGDVVDTYHGVRVPDPFRWLEDASSVETTEWVRAQNAVTMAWLEKLPARTALAGRLTALWNHPRVGVPVRLRNGVLFHRRNSGLQKQDEIVARSSPATAPRVIIDPNELSPDGSLALTQFVPAPDGRHVAYALSEGGADWQEVRIRDVRTRRDREESLKWVRFSGLAWTADGQGFFYSRYPARDEATRLTAPLEHHALYYHKLGTTQDQDALIYERRDLPSWFVFGSTSDDGRYLFVLLAQGADTRNRLYVADLGDPKAPTVRAAIRPLVEEDDGEYTVIGNSGSTVFVRTDLDAPRRRIVAIDLARPARPAWRTVVAEGPHAIDDAAVTSSSLVVNQLVDVKSQVSIFSFAGKALGTVSLPGVGTVALLSTSSHSPSFYYAFTSQLHPTTVFRYEAPARRSVPFYPTAVAMDPSRYETVQLFARSKDGTRVPLFLTSRRGMPRDGTTPTVLYGYGGFAVNLLPSFSPAVIAWLEMGGAYVTATLRGGAEYGETWHRDGMRDRKQNVFDDFVAAAEYLIAERITSSDRLAIKGGSNGGLLVGAAMTQRPELFAAAIPEVGVLDMLRYHKFTGGVAWATEYGAADDSTAFQYLRSYSPLHAVRQGTCYPATLITTADHDDRVVPSHSFKFAAALQQAQSCDRPVLIRVETQGSHGYRPVDRLIAEAADVWSYIASRLGVQPTTVP
jgi:prolyl oligopeptidase